MLPVAKAGLSHAHRLDEVKVGHLVPDTLLVHLEGAFDVVTLNTPDVVRLALDDLGDQRIDVGLEGLACRHGPPLVPGALGEKG